MENPTQKAEIQEHEGHHRKKWRRFLPLLLRRLLQLVLMLVFLPIAIFQIPWVQNKAAQELTKYLSTEWKTDVKVGRVQLGIFNTVKLEHFYLEDLKGDTLLYAGNLEISHSGVFDLLLRKFKIETLRLEDAEVRISREAGQKAQNFQFIVDYFSPKDKHAPSSPKKAFQLDLRHLYLDRVHFLKPDGVKGELFDVYVEHSEGHFDKFDLAGKRIELSSFELDGPVVRITLNKPNPLPDELPTVLEQPVDSTDTLKLVITIADFNLNAGRFSLRNFKVEPKKLTPDSILNYNYLDVMDLEIHFNDFSFSELEFAGEVEKIACRDTTGFVLENLSAKQAALSCRGMELYGVNLKTPFTELGDTLVFRYGGSYTAWEDFVNEVKIDGRFHDSKVALRDVMKFAPALENNPFFKENKEQIVDLDGQIKGPINRLDGKNLKIKMAEGLQIAGSFSTLNLAVPEEQFLHLKLDRLQTDVWMLRKLIPKFKPPENFNSLGKLDFSGKFDGFFDDFVADGKLKTDIGRAEMFMNLKLREGKDKAKYSGELYLHDFDLGKWSGNKDLGKVTLDTQVKQGVGLTLSKVSAELEGVVDSLTYKGYVYRNATIKGSLQRNRFIGDFKINDGNLDLVFGGEINFTEKIPSFNFKADVNKLDLKPLNFTDKDLQFFGKIALELKGIRLSDITGTANATDFYIVKNRKDTLTIDSAVLSSTWDADKAEKIFKVNSTLGDMNITGNFDIEKIPSQLSRFVSLNYPEFAERLKLAPAVPQTDTSRFEFDLKVRQLQDLVNFFEEKLHGFDESIVKGSYDGYKNMAYLEVEVPSWEYENIKFKDVYLRSKLNGPEGSLQLGVIETAFSETQKLSPISLIGTVYSDTLEFLIISSNFYKILDNININGVLSLEDDNAMRISFKPSDLVVLNDTWNISTDNFLRIGNKSIETSNFILNSGQRNIMLSSVKGEGLELQLNNYPIDSLAFLKDIKKLKISGNGDLTAKVKNVFKFEGLSTLLRINDLTVNGDNYGVLRLDATTNNLKEPVTVGLTIEGDTTLLVADGYFNPPGVEPKAERKWQKGGPLYFDFKVDIEKYPVKIVNYFVPEVLNPKGSLSATDVHFFGQPSKPEISGLAKVEHVEFGVKPIGVKYRVPDGQVTLSNRIFDARDTWVLDPDNNRARLDGGITHNHFKDFGLDLTISTETKRPFIGMNTTEKDNPSFYGRAVGTGHVRFTNSFKKPELRVNATTTAGTHLFLPMSSSVTSKNAKFIEFTKPTLETNKPNGEQPKLAELRGLNMYFDVNITEEAVMEVVFDRTWGDVLKGTGTGNLLVDITREGDFVMNGSFTVVTGEYLFTMMRLGLNKPFIVEKGGTIFWTGNPYDAIIDIKATYGNLNTSVYNLIAEYLASSPSDVQDLARNSTPVNLTMGLTGKLLKPDIAFSISLPNVASELRNYVDNKLRTVRLDPNELNRQVFGLLMLGQFMPSGYNIVGYDIGINTLSEMLSNQASILLTEFISDFLTGKNLVKGIDFNIKYNRFTTGFDADNIGNFTSNELQTSLKVIVNDRFSIKAGGNFGNQSFTGNTGILAGEFTVEYALTKDKRLVLRVYAGTEADILSTRRNRQGLALSYRREFDSFSELFNEHKKNREMKNKRKRKE
jgi:hypothetical protein